MEYTKGDLLTEIVEYRLSEDRRYIRSGGSIFIVVDTDPPLLPGYYQLSKLDNLAKGEPNIFHYTHNYAHNYFEKMG